MVTGDHFTSGWIIDAMKEVGIRYIQSDRNRSQIYLDALPLFTSGRVRLLDNHKMIEQFVRLERRTGAGADKVDHPKTGSDDCCNSAAGALTLCRARPPMQISPECLRRLEVDAAMARARGRHL
jgi:hypothetical protein